MAETALRRLKCDSDTRERVLYLVEKHDTWLPDTEKGMARLLLKEGADRLKDLLIIERCDALAHAPAARGSALANVERWAALLKSLLQKQPCLSLHDLAVSGKDLLALGMVPGPQVGALLNQMLELTAEGMLPNERQALLAFARTQI